MEFGGFRKNCGSRIVAFFMEYQPVEPVPEYKNQKEPVDGLLDNVKHSMLPPAPQAMAKTNIQPLVAVRNKKQTYAAGNANKPYLHKECGATKICEVCKQCHEAIHNINN